MSRGSLLMQQALQRPSKVRSALSCGHLAEDFGKGLWKSCLSGVSTSISGGSRNYGNYGGGGRGGGSGSGSEQIQSLRTSCFATCNSRPLQNSRPVQRIAQLDGLQRQQQRNIAFWSSSPSSRIIALQDSRRVLRIAGTGCKEFLQGLCTQDVYRFSTDGELWPALFLNPKGRILCDVILQRESDDSFLVDVHSQVAPKLLTLLRRHRLRLPILLEDVTRDFVVLVSIPDASLGSTEWLEGVPPDVASRLKASSDPRTSQLGSRLIVPRDTYCQIKPAQEEVASSAEAWYGLFRHTIGVPEGPAELVPEKALPQKANLDFLNFINFEKGCYTGQELTIRTHHRGKVRRRLGIFRLNEKDDATTLKWSNSDGTPRLTMDDVRMDSDELTDSAAADTGLETRVGNLALAAVVQDEGMHSRSDAAACFRVAQKEAFTLGSHEWSLFTPPFFFDQTPD